jgi:hypothetical protein
MATMRWLVLSGLLAVAACSSSPTEPSLTTSGAEQHTVREGGRAPRGCPQTLGFPQVCSGGD